MDDTADETGWEQRTRWLLLGKRNKPRSRKVILIAYARRSAKIGRPHRLQLLHELS
jgi:hypothetical protein